MPGVQRVVLAVLGVVLAVGVAMGAVAAVRRAPATGASATVSPAAATTARLPRTRPEAVVAAFLAAVRAGDCNRQVRYVTPELVSRVGGCTASRPSPHLRWYDVTADVDVPGRTARVSFEVSDVGTEEGRVFALVVRGGAWRVDDFRAEASPTPTAASG